MPEALKALVAAGAELNALDDRGILPLADASADATRILLGFGAPANGVPGARPPLHEAAKQGDSSRVEQLLAAGADPTSLWQKRRAIDAAFAGMRKHHSNSYEWALEHGGITYVEVVDQLVAADGAEWTDHLALRLGIHPLDARSRLLMARLYAFI